MFYSGADPVTLLDDLRELGQAHITAHADQVPPLASLEAEHCYLWWEILLVTDRDQAAIKDVFVFVEDECDVRIRLLEDQGGAVALLGSVPAEAFELFRGGVRRTPGANGRGRACFGGAIPRRGTTSILFFGAFTASRAMRVCCWDTSRAPPLQTSHPLQLLVRVAHGLESLLDPFRGASAGPVSEETIQTALEACDAIRTLLGSLTHNGAGGPVSPELLGRLGVRD